MANKNNSCPVGTNRPDVGDKSTGTSSPYTICRNVCYTVIMVLEWGKIDFNSQIIIAKYRLNLINKLRQREF